jgi:hypothetical protein
MTEPQEPTDGTYPIEPLQPGTVAIELDCPLPNGVPSLMDWLYEGNPSEAEHYAVLYTVRLEPVSDEGPNGVPTIRMSGYHENVRNALVQYFNGDEEYAAQAYTAVMNSISTGSAVGSVGDYYIDTRTGVERTESDGSSQSS